MLPPNPIVVLVQSQSSLLTPADFAAMPGVVDFACAHSVGDVFRLLDTQDVALVVIDASDPKDDAWRCATTIRSHPDVAPVPIVFVTAGEPTPELFERIASIPGADYLPMVGLRHLLHHKIEAYVEIRRHKASAGQEHGRRHVGVGETELAQAAERFRVLLAASPDYGLFYLDPDGSVREWTPNAERLFGYSAADAVGADLGLIFTAGDRAAGVPRRALEQATRQGQATDQRWYGRKDGSLFFGASRLVAMRDGGTLRGFVQILRDATARKEAETKLREALDQFQNLADNMSQLAWMADATGSRYWFNQRWFDYTGASFDESQGWGWCAFVHPDHRDATRRIVEEAIKDAAAFQHTVPLRSRTGEYRWFLSQAAPIKDQAGKVVRWCGTSTDTNDDVVLRCKLSASEEKFREIFETANEGIWVVDRAGRVEIVNHRMAELLGYQIGDLVGHHKADFAFEEDKVRFARLTEQRRLRSAMSIELRFRHRHGHEVWTLMSSCPLRRGHGAAGALEMFTDVTARKLVEQALRSSEEQFRAFFDSATAGHAFVEPGSQRFLHVNARLAEITGHPVEDLKRLSLSDITHPGDRGGDEQQWKRLYRGEIVELATEKRYLRRDGATIWAHVTSTVLRHPDGTPRQQLCVMQETTRRKAVELELAERSTYLQLAVETAQLGTFFNDEETGTHIWNERNKILLGLEAGAEPSFEAFLARVHPDDRARVERKLRTVSRARPPGRDFAVEYRVVWPDGTIRYIAARGRSIRERRNHGTIATRLIGTALDVTAVKRFEQELRRQVAQRTSALQERTEQLEAFSYTVAHDLRAPLRAISGYADILNTEFAGPLGSAGGGYVEKIQRAAERMNALICDLLAFSRIMQIRVVTEPVALQTVVQGVLADLRPEIERRNAEVRLASALPVVRAERSLLEQIVRHLLANALKFVAPGVVPVVTICATETGEAVTVKITDNGIGIPAEYHERIFRVFERLEPSRDYTGTGVGLAIAAKAVERLGGRIGLESQPGQGSTFWFELAKA